jgi:phosphodiesterase/alkaline phosphatase D-like protein
MIRFAYSGDETGFVPPDETAPFYGDMKAFRSMAAENNDFNIDIGDTIYSDPELPRRFNVSDARTVQEKWGRYREKLAVANQRAVRAATGIYNHWDDHEFINNFSREADGTELYEAGVEAFRDYMPVMYSSQEGIYRSFRWGKNLELFFLDERSFRSADASTACTVDIPNVGEVSIPFPTASGTIRGRLVQYFPPLGLAASPACLDEINDPDRTLLGPAQFKRFLQDVSSSTARWKVVMNADPIQLLYADPYDQWEGYAYERVKLLKALVAANVDHLVFLATSRHAALANVVRYRTLAGESAPANAPTGPPPINTPYREFVVGPVATLPFWGQIDARTVPGTGQKISKGVFKPAPPQGLGMACARGDVPSYAQVTVTENELRVAYKDENGGTIHDADDSTPCGPYVLTD